MNPFLNFLLFSIIVLSCKNKQQNGLVTIGEYFFRFPDDFTLVEEKGLDSYVGRIKGGNLQLGFDYGFYSDPLVETPQEFLEIGFWKADAYTWFIKPKGSFTLERTQDVLLLGTKPIQTKADSIQFNGADLIAICKLDKSVFNYGITFPDKTKEYEFLTDTINGHYRKIVVAKDPIKGITGIYLKDLRGFNKSVNASSALSMATSKLTKQQQDSVISVFRNVKVTNEK